MAAQDTSTNLGPLRACSEDPGGVCRTEAAAFYPRLRSNAERCPASGTKHVSPSAAPHEPRLTLYGEQLADWPLLWGEISVALQEAERDLV
jgi:hypothetical protein